jgi:xanthine/uracil/vitamin C permease (AzgA family)
MSERREPPRVDAHPSGAILRGAGLPALAAVTVVALAGLGSDRDHALSALVGGGLGIVALAVGPVLQWLCRRLDPALALGVAVLAYCLVVGVAGFGYSALNDLPWLSGRWTAGGLLAAILAWTTGQMRAVSKLRQLLWSDAPLPVSGTTGGAEPTVRR